MSEKCTIMSEKCTTMKCTNMKCTTLIVCVSGNQQSSICVFDLVISSRATSHTQGLTQGGWKHRKEKLWIPLRKVKSSVFGTLILCFWNSLCIRSRSQKQSPLQPTSWSLLPAWVCSVRGVRAWIILEITLEEMIQELDYMKTEYKRDGNYISSLRKCRKHKALKILTDVE